MAVNCVTRCIWTDPLRDRLQKVADLFLCLSGVPGKVADFVLLYIIFGVLAKSKEKPRQESETDSRSEPKGVYKDSPLRTPASLSKTISASVTRAHEEISNSIAENRRLMATTLLSGAAFGAALLAAGFHQPIAVISQLNLENWHMVQAFVTTTASSAAIYAILRHFNFVTLKPRSSSPVGLISTYDGNVIGGTLLGVGMALSASCPGTLLVQTAVGVPTGIYALAGAIFGGTIWSGLLRNTVKSRNEKYGVKPQTVTLDETLGTSSPATVLLFQSACVAVVAGSALLTDRASWSVYSGITGGIFISCAQAFSLLTRKSMMGISGSYEEVGNYISWLFRGVDSNSRPKAYNNILFAVGATLGAFGLGQLAPWIVTQPVGDVSEAAAFAGGAIMVIGSRMAGGCTSGHGISGLSLMSVSSAVTIASTFAGGMALAPLLR